MTPKQAADLLLEFRAAIEAEGSTYTAKHAEAVVMACAALEKAPTGSGMLSAEERAVLSKLRSDLKGGNKRGAVMVALVDRLTADLASARAENKALHKIVAIAADFADQVEGRMTAPPAEIDGLREAIAQLAGSGGAKEEPNG